MSDKTLSAVAYRLNLSYKALREAKQQLRYVEKNKDNRNVEEIHSLIDSAMTAIGKWYADETIK